jgi:large subunit ribosomal protein L15
MKLDSLPKIKGSTHRHKILGRGRGTGHGKTSGRGHKGMKARSGGGHRPGFEGGQMPIARRLPKKGFNNAQFKTNYAIVNVAALEAKFSDGDEVNEATLRAVGLVKGVCDGVKVLANGDLSRKLTVSVDKISTTAKEMVEKAGGSVIAS